MKEAKLKKWTVILIQALLILPLVQRKTSLFDIAPLKGAIVQESNVFFTWTGWYDESYQHGKEKYINQQFGFRNTLVRLNNQIDFSVFNKANANGVVVGKQNYLYEENYIRDFKGANFIGRERIREVVNRLVSIDSVFRKLNKTLLVVFAPGKASFYPEFIPDRYLQVNDSTNFKSYREAIATSGISYIDFNTYFCQQKNRGPFLLYPKTGIHWSDYGSLLAVDSISRLLGSLRGYDPVQMYWDEYIQKDSVSMIDGDIESGMNLLFEISKPRLRYPIVQYDEAGKYRPSLINIGDSFYWNIYSKDVANKLFNHAGFGYYFKDIYSPLLTTNTDVDEVDVKSLIDQYEVVMLLYTEATMERFPDSFDKIVYDLYCTELSDTAIYQSRLKAIEDQIRNEPTWLNKVKEKAKKKNRSVEEMIRLDALFVLRTSNQ